VKCRMGWRCQRQEGAADQTSKNGQSQWFHNYSSL